MLFYTRSSKVVDDFEIKYIEIHDDLMGTDDVLIGNIEINIGSERCINLDMSRSWAIGELNQIIALAEKEVEWDR